MGKPRKQTYTMDMYLNKVNDSDIRNDADTQRQFVWSKEQVNELIVTVLTEDYIPPIILAEENDSQLWIVDGGQRTAALSKYRNGNHKITSAIENSIIFYKAKKKDKNGDICLDNEGNIVWEEASFDIKNKTYDKLPVELKKRFNEYQIETVIHENCDNHRISKLIKRYNNHTSMNVNQRAFTYIDNFARSIREILNRKFFLDHSDYKESEKIKGVTERVVVETIMCSNHFDNWKKPTKAICEYLNENANKEEFEKLSENLSRLEKVITEDIKEIFNSKDSFIFLTLFEKFTRLGCDDNKFAEFLREFKNDLRINKKSKNGLLFDEIDKDKGTKDKSVITSKLDMLEEMMKEYLHIDEAKSNEISAETFIAENLNMDINEIEEDIDFYNKSLDDLINKTIKDEPKLLHNENRLSLLAMVAYSYKEDIDLEEWLTNYAKNNNTYFVDQKKNFIHMRDDLKKFISNKNRICA